MREPGSGKVRPDTGCGSSRCRDDARGTPVRATPAGGCRPRPAEGTGSGPVKCSHACWPVATSSGRSWRPR